MKKPEMKMVEYRGGVLTFRIPSHWKEEYEEKGGATFYEDAPDSGTLRLNILTFEAPIGKLPACGYDDLAARPSKTQSEIVRLPAGDGMRIYRKDAEEAGESLHVYYWEVAHCAPPQKYYLAVFSWTILAAQSAAQEFQDEIQLITDELKQIGFHPGLGSL